MFAQQAEQRNTSLCTLLESNKTCRQTAVHIEPWQELRLSKATAVSFQVNQQFNAVILVVINVARQGV